MYGVIGPVLKLVRVIADSNNPECILFNIISPKP